MSAVAFRIDPAPTFEATVGIRVPGAAEFVPLRLVLRHKGRRDLKAWIDRALGNTDRTDSEFLAEVVAGWSGVRDSTGQDVPYSPEALEALLDAYPAAGTQIYEGYIDAIAGARRKN